MVNGDQSSIRDRAWEIKLLQSELSQLQREKTHLTSKSLQRPLSSWEKFRLTIVFRDTRSLLREISRLSETYQLEGQDILRQGSTPSHIS